MLPKPEKNKKVQSASQLDLLDAVSSEDKLKKKRRSLIILLVLFVGSSLVFYLYRRFTSISFTLRPPSFDIRLPSFSFFSPRSPLSTTDEVENIIKSDRNYWSVYLQSPPSTSSAYVWSRNPDQIFSQQSLSNILRSLQSLSPNPNSTLLDSLPQGASVKEIVTSQADYYQISALIVVPGRQMLFVAKVSGSNNLQQSQQLIPSLAKNLYWSAISQTR